MKSSLQSSGFCAFSIVLTLLLLDQAEAKRVTTQNDHTSSGTDDDMREMREKVLVIGIPVGVLLLVLLYCYMQQPKEKDKDKTGGGDRKRKRKHGRRSRQGTSPLPPSQEQHSSPPQSSPPRDHGRQEVEEGERRMANRVMYQERQNNNNNDNQRWSNGERGHSLELTPHYSSGDRHLHASDDTIPPSMSLDVVMSSKSLKEDHGYNSSEGSFKVKMNPRNSPIEILNPIGHRVKSRFPALASKVVSRTNNYSPTARPVNLLPIIADGSSSGGGGGGQRSRSQPATASKSRSMSRQRR